jgi:4a-hydroxytetrahydrobiopterin dehydratase
MINPMNEVQITESLKGLPGWTFGDNKLHKIYKFNDFREAMAFLVRLSYEAENRNHHPEIFNCYNRWRLGLIRTMLEERSPIETSNWHWQSKNFLSDN